MLLFPRTLLATSIGVAFFVPTTQAELSDTVEEFAETIREQEVPFSEQCLIADTSNPNKDNTNSPIHVEANSVEATNGEVAVYQGNVVITQGHQRILADTVTLLQQENMVVAEGNVQTYDGQIKTISDKATTHLDSNIATLENTQYRFLCEDGRGSASVIHRSEKAFYQLKDGSITSCPEGDNSWSIKATSIDINQTKEEATLYNPRVEILNVPIFYLPYLTIPIGDTRKTGFLYPSISLDTKDGFGLLIPIYWNLAPNYDLRTDIQYMKKRGTQVDTKFRYLTTFGTGSINTEYLSKDKKHSEQKDRWGVNWNHNGVFQRAWKFEVDYSKVSDIQYFSDLDSNIGNREDGQLLQSGELSYRSKFWNTTLRVRDFQVLSKNSYPYRLVPQIEHNYYAPQFYSKLDFNLLSHISRFETDAPSAPSTARVHFEPTLTLPLSNTWGTLTAETKLFQTYYDQDIDNLPLATANTYKEHVSRTVPQIKIHSAIYLERETSQINGYTQTLEPQIQYLFIPDKEQSSIYSSYDTTKLQLDYNGIFRSQKYSSIDYIAPANQFSYGASSRFYDDTFKERMNISFGQILYLNDSYNDSTLEGEPSSYSAWALETEFNYNDDLFYQGGFQYDTASSQIQLADSTFEYRYTNGYSQINYRYVSLDYITNNVDFITGDDYVTYTQEGINQLGFISSYQAGKHWKIRSQYFHDINENVSLEWLAGINYTSDCWYIGFSYSNQLYAWNEVGVGKPTYEQNFTINFGIIGFGQTLSGGSGLAGFDTSDSSLNYSRPFYLQ